jgi:hypothetical protein
MQAHTREEPTPRTRPRYARGVIGEPFLLAVALGAVVSAGLYAAYVWPAPRQAPSEPGAPHTQGSADADEPAPPAASPARGAPASAEPTP